MPIWITVLVLLISSRALAAPSMKDQKNWTEGDKQEFLKYLDTGRGAPISGQVRDVAFPESAEEYRAPARKPFYLALEANTSRSLGPRVLAGNHLFSWIRYFAGIEFHSFERAKLNGSMADVSDFQVPLGLEFALIPLGFPHTEYILLRGGLGLHAVSSDAESTEFANSILGVRLTWNLGIGYEWQIKETGFRVHALAEAQIATGSLDNGFTSLGATVGVAYMF